MESIAKRYENLYSGVIYDALTFDIKYEKPFVADLELMDRTFSGTYFGKALTCKGEDVCNHNQIDDTIRIKMFKAFTPGCIQVIDCSDNKGVAHFGDISGKLARKFGAKCAVVDGFTRDASIITKDKFSVFCKGVTPIDAFEKWQIVDYDCNIQLSGLNGQKIDVNRDDYIFCDGDGCMVIKNTLVEEVLKFAEKRNQNEELVRKEIEKTDDIMGLYNNIGRW